MRVILRLYYSFNVICVFGVILCIFDMSNPQIFSQYTHLRTYVGANSIVVITLVRMEKPIYSFVKNTTMIQSHCRLTDCRVTHRSGRKQENHGINAESDFIPLAKREPEPANWGYASHRPITNWIILYCYPLVITYTLTGSDGCLYPSAVGLLLVLRLSQNN